jgi:uncharacterized protein YecE (DUF72 family)
VYRTIVNKTSEKEKNGARIEREENRLEELQRWSKEVIKLKDKARIAVVAANNHYAGFGPATANSFRKMRGLKEVLGEEMKQEKL